MLTEAGVRALKPKDKQYKASDSEGLYLVVNTTGSKLWRLKYRINGIEKSLSIGKYPQVSINQARLKRSEAKELIAQGIDPSAAKQEAKAIRAAAAVSAVPTFKTVAFEYLDEVGTIRGWTSKHAMKIASTLNLHVYPIIGAMPIADIEPGDVLKCYQAMQKKGLTELPSVALENIQQVFLFGAMKKYTKTNPVPAMKMFIKKVVGGHMAAMHYSCLGEFQLRLSTSKSDELFRLATLFLMHTAVRTKEMRMARWEEFDLKRRIWSIPGERMKRRAAHTVPLTDQVIALLGEIKALGVGSPYVFGSQYSRKNPFISENSIMLTIKGLGYLDKQGKATHTGHGFRTCFSSACNAHKDLFGANGHEAIEFCLAHVKENQIEAAYNREEYWQTRVQIMTWYSQYLEWLKTEARVRPDVVQRVFDRESPSIDQDRPLSSAMNQEFSRAMGNRRS